MESINTLKGYDKVTDQESQIPSPLPNPPPSRKTLITATVSLLLILTIVALTTVAFFTHRPSHSSNSLKTLCAVTRYPKTCFNTLSSSSLGEKKLDPESILELSLQAAAKKVSNLTLSFRSINDMPEEAAVGDCVKLYADAVSQLNESVAEIERERKKGGSRNRCESKTRSEEFEMTAEKNGYGYDETAEVSVRERAHVALIPYDAAMSDGETCEDGVEEMGTVVGEEIKREMVMVSEMMSVSLGIVSEMKKLLMVFH
ncbi:unnamed protein product [Eruca vesicaria subsp. sativa]|uniref:Pectinesterase inhibitor domain-containing protein n=1 Tax=Eruca vesicaria subsp. sativa TaxID=29727 RepID=A0ABC8K1E2_ERUVS|nr:unnamed protein product [Eruca vesicaria subsp. sativa]